MTRCLGSLGVREWKVIFDFVLIYCEDVNVREWKVFWILYDLS